MKLLVANKTVEIPEGIDIKVRLGRPPVLVGGVRVGAGGAPKRARDAGDGGAHAQTARARLSRSSPLAGRQRGGRRACAPTAARPSVASSRR
jgi:hypothetical protein